MKTFHASITHGTLVVAVLLTVLGGLMSVRPAAAAGGPYLPDLDVTALCRIWGPEGLPKLRITMTNTGNDVAENQVKITVKGSLPSGITLGQNFLQAISLQAGQSFSVTVTLVNRFLSPDMTNAAVDLSLFYVTSSYRKPMDEHGINNNREPFSYLELPGC